MNKSFLGKDIGWLLIVVDVVLSGIFILYIWNFLKVLSPAYKYGYVSLVVAMTLLSCYRIYYFYY